MNQKTIRFGNWDVNLKPEADRFFVTPAPGTPVSMRTTMGSGVRKIARGLPAKYGAHVREDEEHGAFVIETNTIAGQAIDWNAHEQLILTSLDQAHAEGLNQDKGRAAGAGGTTRGTTRAGTTDEPEPVGTG